MKKVLSGLLSILIPIISFILAFITFLGMTRINGILGGITAILIIIAGLAGGYVFFQKGFTIKDHIVSKIIYAAIMGFLFLLFFNPLSIIMISCIIFRQCI